MIQVLYLRESPLLKAQCLTKAPSMPRLADMEVRFSPELEAKINRAAADVGHGTEDYVRELVERYIDDDTRFRSAVRKGFASLDRGEFIDEAEMNARVERMLRS